MSETTIDFPEDGRIILGGLHVDDLPWVLKNYGKYFHVVSWKTTDGHHFEAVLQPKNYDLLLEFLEKAVKEEKEEFVVLDPRNPPFRVPYN